MPPSKKPKNKFRLDDHLILAPFIANELGLKAITDIRKFNDVQEGFDTTGHSYIFYRLLSQGGLNVSEDDLRRYDDNIRRHVKRLSDSRGVLIQLKYFQHLALLFMEVYLDQYFKDPIGLMNRLYEYQREKKLLPKKPFTEKDMTKLAMWLATGSGKTLLLHINLWQIREYNTGKNAIDFENTILITPNEGLSDQHEKDMGLSGIKTERYRGRDIGFFASSNKEIVKIVEIYKLKLPQDRMGEETFDVTEMGDKNLVFVDEGHKGQKTDEGKWMSVREKLAKNGFTVEYSATYGQIVKEGKGAEPSTELVTYSKAILFNYSYKFFHSDGYGKDFHLLNLEKGYDEHLDTMMLANAVSFYEQVRVHQDLGDAARDYNIEQPLWVFLGHKVQDDESDILTVMRFFVKLLENKDGWVNNTVAKLLEGDSGFTVEGRDVFARRYPESVFPYLREKGISADEIVNGIYGSVFSLNPGVGRKLYLYDITRAEGELGLKASAGSDYFGVVNIGDKSKLRNFIKKEESNIRVAEDAMTDSLFKSIEENGTTLSVLIGAKKFIEGWSSWRVSTMGLMNVGKSEGPQIIQLFGRGVRLKGRGFSLKRSTSLDDIVHPRHIEVLETLGIFGIKANYLTKFEEMLELEDVKRYEILRLPIKNNTDLLKDLKMLRLKKDANFTDDCIFSISEINGVTPSLDLHPRVDDFKSSANVSIVNTTSEREAVTIDESFKHLLDWSRIYLEMLSYRAERRWFNLSFTVDDLKKLIANNKYDLRAPVSYIRPEKFQDLARLEDVVIQLLKNYLEKCYNKKRKDWEKDKLEMVQITDDDTNFPKDYTVSIESSAAELIKMARELISSGEVYTAKSNDDPLPNIFYEKHLYQPLLARTRSSQVLFHHTGLNESERRFVSDLSKFIIEKPGQLKKCECYLLRNMTRGKGIGFFETNSFYPDFILWLKSDDFQHMIFIEPHGMIFSSGLNDEKVKLYSYLKDQIMPRFKDDRVKLDAYMISATSFEKFKSRHGQSSLTIKECADKHVLFLDKSEGRPNPDYIEDLFRLILVDT